MRTAKGNQDDDDYDDDDFISKKEGTSNHNNATTTTTTTSTTTSKDGKNTDKANAIRSKHSVTEQRRRSKINERFQILRDLIPHSDQKRDTASFLLEVIEYVQYLQERVHKYEGSYQDWNSETSKLMPWRNSHWRVQNFVGHPQAIKNGSGPAPTFSGKFDDNSIGLSPTMLTSTENPVEPDPSRDIACKAMDGQPELANRGIALPMPMQANVSAPVRSDGGLLHPLQRPVSDAQSNECLITSDTMNQQEELTVEGGTISISSGYSQGCVEEVKQVIVHLTFLRKPNYLRVVSGVLLLNSLTQALQSAGLDLSQANISVQIDLGKRANRGLTSGTSTVKDPPNSTSSNAAMVKLRDVSSGDDSDQAQKRLKT